MYTECEDLAYLYKKGFFRKEEESKPKTDILVPEKEPLDSRTQEKKSSPR